MAYMHNCVTGEFESVNLDTADADRLRDFIPRYEDMTEGGPGLALYDLYLQQGMTPLDALRKVLEASVGKD